MESFTPARCVRGYRPKEDTVLPVIIFCVSRERWTDGIGFCLFTKLSKRLRLKLCKHRIDVGRYEYLNVPWLEKQITSRANSSP